MQCYVSSGFAACSGSLICGAGQAFQEMESIQQCSFSVVGIKPIGDDVESGYLGCEDVTFGAGQRVKRLGVVDAQGVCKEFCQRLFFIGRPGRALIGCGVADVAESGRCRECCIHFIQDALLQTAGIDRYLKLVPCCADG